MGQKVIIRFRWESGLSCGYKNHLTIFADLSSTRVGMFKIVFGDSTLHSKKTAIANIEASRHLLSQQEKQKLKVSWSSINNNNFESFLAYFMRILNSCVV